MIGSQIDMKLKNQQELEKIFDDLIIEKKSKVPLVEEETINKLNVEINKYAEELKYAKYFLIATSDSVPFLFTIPTRPPKKSFGIGDISCFFNNSDNSLFSIIVPVISSS